MKEKKEKKKWGLIILLVFIMIGTSFSFIFLGFQPQNEVSRYNELKFVRHQGWWEAKINGRTAAFSFLPGEVEKIPAFGDFSRILRNKFEVDITYDMNSTYNESIALAQYQISLTLAQYGVFVRKGFTANNTFNIPVITCNEATSNVPVVYFRQGNTTRINLENNCVIAHASSDMDFIKVKDRMLYEILGVVK